jgi:hypothetical protein
MREQTLSFSLLASSHTRVGPAITYQSVTTIHGSQRAGDIPQLHGPTRQVGTQNNTKQHRARSDANLHRPKQQGAIRFVQGSVMNGSLSD